MNFSVIFLINFAIIVNVIKINADVLVCDNVSDTQGA